MIQKQSSKHPSGLTWERWEFPFKTPEERALIQQWLMKKDCQNEFDDSIPF